MISLAMMSITSPLRRAIGLYATAGDGWACEDERPLPVSGKPAPAAFALLALIAAPPATLAQDAFWEVEQSVEVLSVISLGDPNAAADGFDQPLTGEAAYGISATRISFSGLESGLRLEARIIADAPGRRGFRGVAGACPPGLADCATTTDGRAPLGAAGGISAFGAIDTDPADLVLEQAYGFVRGGWGEVSLGRDIGAALRFSDALPGGGVAFRLDNPGLDPTGVGQVRTVNDPTGPSAKLTYASPRWAGVRLGASFTPRADAIGADVSPGVDLTAGGVAPDLERLGEVAVSYVRRLPGRARLSISVSHAFGDAANGHLGFDALSQTGATMRWEAEPWALGVAALTSNNAWAAAGDYASMALGVERTLNDWTLGAQIGVSDDDLANVTGENWILSLNREFGEGRRLSLGWADYRRQAPEIIDKGRVAQKQRNAGPFIELAFTP